MLIDDDWFSLILKLDLLKILHQQTEQKKNLRNRNRNMRQLVPNITEYESDIKKLVSRLQGPGKGKLPEKCQHVTTVCVTITVSVLVCLVNQNIL